MAHIRVIHDPVGETLTIYWKEPSREQICEETGEGVILIKDRHSGDVIGFERLYYRPDAQQGQTVTVETIEATLLQESPQEVHNTGGEGRTPQS